MKKLFGTMLHQELVESGTQKHFAAGSILQQNGSYIRSIPLLLSGSARVLRQDEDGKEILLYYIKPGESCIMSFLAGIHEDTCKVLAVIEEDAEVLMIPVQKAEQWVTRFPEWADFIFRQYHRRFEELLDIVDAVSFRQLDERIVSLLRKKALMSPSDEIIVTHRQLAEELGTTREVVSRLLKQMENKGLVRLSRNKIELLPTL